MNRLAQIVECIRILHIRLRLGNSRNRKAIQGERCGKPLPGTDMTGQNDDTMPFIQRFFRRSR